MRTRNGKRKELRTEEGGNSAIRQLCELLPADILPERRVNEHDLTSEAYHIQRCHFNPFARRAGWGTILFRVAALAVFEDRLRGLVRLHIILPV